MELFPNNIAIGNAFCNRVKERKQLTQYIQHGRHTVLIAPRRYGKTSLINQVLLELNLPHCILELTMATSTKDVEEMLLKHVGHLLYEMLPKPLKAKQNILRLFKWLNPELILTVGGQKLVFHPEHTHSALNNITEALKKLDDVARITHKRCVVVMDEFQQLNEMKDHAIEASIRHAMQYSQHVSYIFSGSNRHMLLSMFNNKNRPFYNSCEMMRLERISPEDYHSFIQKAAKEHWGQYLPDEVLNDIFKLSELHPSYINQICGYFWLIDKFPSQLQIEDYWRNFIEGKHTQYTQDILNLSKNQRKVLAYLANHPTQHMGSHDICHTVNVPEASIRQAVRRLMWMDYLYKDKDGIIRVLDPALKDFMNKRLSSNQ